MKDWIKKRIKECNANNIIIFPLREEDVERRLRNIEMDKELEENPTIEEKENDHDEK
mgnify:CR=1 FL=1